mgnify:CR=1 FL=1
MKKHNFSAGPCILPQSVLQQASDAIKNFDDLNDESVIKEFMGFNEKDLSFQG